MKTRTLLLFALSLASLVSAQTTKYSTDLLALNPLGFWPLAGTFNDVSGHGAALTPTGGPSFVSGGAPLGVPGGPCCMTAVFDNGAFAGANSAAFSLSGTHAMTLMAWTKTIVEHNASVIVGKVDPATTTGWALGIDNGDLGAPVGSGHMMFIFAAAGTPLILVESTVSVNDGAAHLLGATYDGSGLAHGVTLYIDGQAAASTALADTLHSTSILTTTPLTVGAANDGSSSVEGNVSQVAVFGTALTPAQMLQLGDDNAGFALRTLPQFAFGGGWYSAVYFSNPNANAVSFPVTFTSDTGVPLNVPSLGGSSVTVTLPPGGSTVLQAPNSGSLVQGYVTMSLPVGVICYGLFRQSVPGIADQEAVVQVISPTGNLNSFAYDDTNYITAVAIENPTAVSVTVTVTAYDSNGNLVATAPMPPLQPLSKTEATLRSIPGMAQVAGKQGLVTFSSSTGGALAVLGLRFNGVAFTTIPALYGKPI